MIRGHFQRKPTVASEARLDLPIDELLASLGASRSGLTSQEAESLLEIYGRNVPAKMKRRTAAVKFLLYFRSPLLIILLFAGLVTTLVGETANAAIIFAMVFMSVILGFYQESKAEKAAEILREKIRTTATVLRDGARQEVPLSDIVPGDIVYLSAGDIVPADSRIFEAKDLFVDQSALTGESFPAEKSASPSASKVEALTERADCLFLGTSVVSGTATAIVARTGTSTEYGAITKRLVAREPQTEFDRGLRRFGYLIMQVTFLLVVFVFFINALYKRGVLESLLFAVALAVGLTPELLPMIVSINLSKGAISMSKTGVIVRRLASIQNFGSMDVLCTDKTGTLTENRITLVLHIDLEGNDDEKVLLYSYLNSYYQTGLKSPLDLAILAHKDIDVAPYRKIDEVPFDFTRKRISIVIEADGERFLTVKGAPEEVVKACSYCELLDRVSDLTPETRENLEEQYRDLGSKGFRALGVAYKKLREDKPAYSTSDETDLIFLGLVAFIDPPKETTKESLRLLRNTGVELKILTGDNEPVTRKVCEQLGFDIKGVVLGTEVAQLQDDALAAIVEKANIFARVTPSQKDRIMNALRNNGHVVGFLGDGINDAASIRTADVGISVDNAVDVARESADIILLRSDLTVLQQGVLEGRKTFGNTMKYIMMGTSSNFGNMFSAAAASLFLPFLPMLPQQILLNNLMYDLSELTIPSDNVDQDYIERPRRWDISFVRDFMIFFGPISSIFDFLTFFVMLFVFKANAALFQTAWFLESLSTQALVIFVIRTRKMPFYKSRPSWPLLFATLGVVVSALVLPFTPLGSLFKFVPPPTSFLALLLVFIAAYLMLAEILKGLFYKRLAKRLNRSTFTAQPLSVGHWRKRLRKLHNPS
jgi:P-type Mg2+ transporter